MVQPRGNQTQLNQIEPEVHGINWTKLEQTQPVSTAPKSGPDIQLPLGQPLNHD